AARSHTVSTNQASATSETEAGIEFVQTTATPAVTNGASVTSSPKVTVQDEPLQREPKLAVAPEVRRISVKTGDFTFLDQTGRLLASFAGVDFRTNIRSAQALRGDAKVARVSLRDRFFLDQLRSPLRYEPDVLELSKISARVAEGEVTG